MEVAYVVPAMSAYDIEVLSASFLCKYESPFFWGYESALDAEHALDACYLETGVCLEIVEDDSIPDEVASLVDVKRKVIQIRKSDYEHIGENGFIRMTVAHEIGHSLGHLKYLETESKLYRSMSNAVVPYRSSEWQARVFASALLMPFPRVVSILKVYEGASDEYIATEISKLFIVSKAAAKVRLSTIRSYQRRGIYWKLVKYFEKIENCDSNFDEYMAIK